MAHTIDCHSKVNLIKALTLVFFIGVKMPKKLFWHLKCHFLATNIEQHIVDLSTYVAHFGILVAHLGGFIAAFH